MKELNNFQIEITQKHGTRTKETMLIQNLLCDVLSDSEYLARIIRERGIHEREHLENKINSLRAVLEIAENDLVQELYETLLKEKEVIDSVIDKLSTK